MAFFSRSPKRVVLPEFDHTVSMTAAELGRRDRPRKLRQFLLLTFSLLVLVALLWFAISALAGLF